MDDFIFARGSFAFDLYYYYFIYLVFIVYYFFNKKQKEFMPVWFMRALAALFVSSLICGIYLGTYGFPMIKQIIGITYTSMAFYTFLHFNDFDIRKIFKIYINIAFFVACYGIFEQALHVIGIHISKDLKKTSFGLYRVYSVMGEPYFLATALTPATYYLLAKTFGYSRYKERGIIHLIKTLCITTCFLFTFSSAGFVAFAIMIIFLLYNRDYINLSSWKFYILPAVIFIFITIFGNVLGYWKELDIRFQDTILAFSQKSFDQKKVSNLNSSSYALYSNYLIATESFSQNPILGSGLGTHEKNYDLRFSKFFSKDFTTRYGSFNKQDANSLFLRLMSETGLLGLVLFFTFMIKNFLGKKGLNWAILADHTLINQGIFILFVIRLLRTGNYIGYGFFLFFFIYYLTHKQLTNKLKELNTGSI